MNSNYLNRYFTVKNIFGLLNHENFDRDSFIGEISSTYLQLQEKYRNEYFYNNTIFNKIVLGKYSLNTTTAFRELSIAKSKTDFVVINKGKGIVYEIKTDLDNLDRLVTQITDYYKVFSEVNIVTSEKNYYPVYKLLKEFDVKAGILVLTDKVTLSSRKLSEPFYDDLSHEHLFKLLRKSEYELLIKKVYNELPNVRPIEYYQHSFQMFKKIALYEAQKMVFKELMARPSIKNTKLLLKLPYELRWLFYKELHSNDALLQVYLKFNKT